MRNKPIVFLTILTSIALAMAVSGCSASYHAGEVNKGLEGDKITVGKVQRQIKVGMSSAEVIEALGSPNVVTTDEQRREVWVYDKIATDVVSSDGYWNVLVMGQGAKAARRAMDTHHSYKVR
jgi:hypothetical protein